MSREIKMATQTTECPVCGRTFRPSLIDEHVNICLNKQNESNPISSLKRKNNAWSFFKREAMSSEPDNSDNPLTRSAKKSAKRFKGKSKVEKSSGSFNEKVSCNKSKLFDDQNSDLDSDLEILSQEHSEINAPESESGANLFGVENESEESRPNNTSSSSNTNKQSLQRDDRHNDRRRERCADPESQRNMTGSRNFGASHGNEAVKYSDTSQNINVRNGNFFQRNGNGNGTNRKEKMDIMKANAPLAERVRPQDLDDYIGQNKAVGKRSLLHSLLLNSDSVPSMILWGPPGCGKTTLAKIIAHRCQQKRSAKFISKSATSASVSEVKELAKVALNDLKMFRKKTILFLDEIHRFNKLQQDALLPHVESGVITLIGATTENPSFQVNGALLSRCRVIILEKLEIDDIKAIIKRACHKLGIKIKSNVDEIVKTEVDGDDDNDDDVNFSFDPFCDTKSAKVEIEESAVNALSGLVDGDARTALNGLQMTMEARMAEKNDLSPDKVLITLDNIKEGLQRSHVLYDRNGEEHFNIASALIKSMRGSDDSAALYWMTRMLVGGEDPLFVARRLVVFASEDVGLADPMALSQAVATYQACHLIGMPECGINLAQCVVYLSRAPKSVEAYMAYSAVKEMLENQQGPMPSVPLHLRNAPTKLLKSLGCGKGYKYPPAFEGEVLQDYLPKELIGTDFFAKRKGERPSDPDLTM